MRIRVSILLFIAYALVGGLWAHALLMESSAMAHIPQTVNLSPEKSVFLIRTSGDNCESRTGTGWIINHGNAGGTFIVTAAHVVTGFSEVFVGAYTGQVIRYLPEKDLALIFVAQTIQAPSLSLSNTPLVVDSMLVSWGHPQGTTLSSSHHYLGYAFSQEAYMTNIIAANSTLPAIPGESGSPLLNSAGAVEGVVYASNPSGGYIVPKGEIASMMQDWENKPQPQNWFGNCDTIDLLRRAYRA